MPRVKTYIHARLGKNDRAALDELKKTTGHSESELVRRGLRLVSEQLGRTKNALDLAGRSVGRFKKGPRDLSTNKRHLTEFGE
jgi:Arc/MetJ-type ribon-helix-helix transcriptional regulator